MPRRAVAILLAGLVVAGTSACGRSGTDDHIGRYDVGGYQMYLECAGEGAPVVVLDQGWGGTSQQWRALPMELRKVTRTCAYDRAGLGRSEPGPSPRDSKQMARELHALLTAASEDGPFILVGWSFGGVVARVFAAEHGDNVAGLVLLDSVHPDQLARLLSVLPTESPSEAAGITAMRQLLVSGYNLGADFRASLGQAGEVTDLGAMPVRVITANPTGPLLAEDLPGIPLEVAALIMAEKLLMHADLLTLSSDSEQTVTARSGHCVHCTEPELVVAVIQKLVSQSR